MGQKTVNVQVPIGGGLNEGLEPHLLPPPHGTVARNVVPRSDGSLTKIPGTDSLGFPSGGTHGFLASRSGGDLISVGVAGGASYGPITGFVDFPAGHIIPFKSRFKPALAVRGLVSAVGVARISDGYTAMVAQVAETDPLVTTTRCVILDSNGTVVWGPYDVDEIGYYPRVEPLGGSIFGFFGMPSGASATLNGFVVQAGVWAAPSVAALATDVGRTATGDNSYVYDTYADGINSLAVLAYITTGGDLVVAPADGFTPLSPLTLHAGAGTDNFAVWYDDTTETVLVYSGTTSSIYTTDLACIDGPNTYVGAGSYSNPVFYRDGSSVRLNGMAIGFSGSLPGPATPSFTGSPSQEVGGLTFRPQRLGNRTEPFFFELGKGHRSSSGTIIPDKTWLEMESPDGTYGSGSRAYAVWPLLSTLVNPAMYNGFHDYAGSPASDQGTVVQTSRDDDADTVLVPVTVDTPGGLTYLRATRTNPLTGDFDLLNREQGGPYNADQVIGWVEISAEANDIEFSAVDFQGSLLVACGPICVWDGRNWLDVTAGPPEFSSTPWNTQTPVTNEDLADWSNIYNSVGSDYAHIAYWGAKVVLVHTDANGIEYRSAPSRAYIQQGIPDQPGGGGPTILVHPCPAVVIELSPSHRRLLDAGGFDVELYVTERDDGTTNGTAVGAATQEDAEASSYYLAQRTPLRESGGVYYVPDFLRAAYHPGNLLSPTGQVIPLYTDEGELSPVRPPASSVIAQAGNYLFLVPNEFPDQLWPTKPLERGRGPEWAAELVISAPAGSGGIESLAGQGDKLILLCKNGIWELFVGGGGPDAFGQGSFGAPRQVHAGDGCVNRKGTVSGPFGVLYIAQSGAKILSPDGSVQDVGRAVSTTLVPANVVGGAYHDGEDEVWVFQSSGDHLIYSTRAGIWTTTDVSSRAAVYHDGEFYRLTTLGRVVQEDTAESQDAGENTLATVTSGWISFQDVLGFKRARELAILIRQISGTIGAIQIKLAYNYDDTVVDTFLFDAATYTGFDLPGQLNVKPTRQKFDAIKVTITDTTVVSGQNDLNQIRWALVGLEFELLPKQGTIKLEQGAKK